MPTTSLEALITTMLIDVFEERDVAIFDILKAYLNALMPDGKTILLKLRDDFVEIMCEINLKYKAHVRVEEGRKVLYLQILRALYGCIESALQWYILYKTTLEKEGFVLNKYDLCVANKVINNKQCTIGWLIDDN